MKNVAAWEGVSADFKSGFVTIIGRPNTGKSTFLNRVLGQKLAIVTHKPQTTRSRILGVYHQPKCQMVFLDTPGIHDPGQSFLRRAMVQTARDACRDVDLVLYFVDLPAGITHEDWQILASLPRGGTPVILIMNKVDHIHRPKLMPLLQAAGAGAVPFVELIPISAKTGENMDSLLAVIPKYLVAGPRYFPEGQVTDQPETFVIAEVIREKLFLSLQQELPYALAVRVESFVEREDASNVWDVEAVVLVERESQKGIVIGKGGQVLKRVGTLARKELEGLFGVRLFLRLWVRVKRDWQENVGLLRDLGYPDRLSRDEETS